MDRDRSVSRDPQAADQPAAGGAAEAKPASGSPGLGTFSSLQHSRDFRYLLGGNVLFNASIWLQTFTVGWLVLDLSGGSALQSATAVGIRSLPVLVVGPWLGALADRVDRRKLAMVLQLWMAAAAVLFALLVASGQVKVWHAYVFVVISGAGFTGMQTVRQALVANTVSKADLPNALALQYMSSNTMRLAGPIMGGILIETVGYSWNFFLQAGFVIAMLLLMLPMRTPYLEAGGKPKSSMLSDVKEGARYVLNNKLMLQLNVVNLARSVVFLPLVFLIPVYTKDVLDGTAGQGTALITAMGIGGLASSLAISSWPATVRKGVFNLFYLAGGAACILVLSQSGWLWISVGMMFLMGIFQNTFNVANATATQTMVPDSLRGRVSALWLYMDGLIPMWVFMISLMAEFTGIAPALTIVGTLAMAAASFFMFRFRELRSFGT